MIIVVMNISMFLICFHSQENLYGYVKDAVDKIVNSALVCPSGMRDVFSTLKTQAMLNYPGNSLLHTG